MTSSISSFRSLILKAIVWLSLFVVANAVARGPVRRLVETPVRQQMEEIARSTAPVVVLGDSHAGALGFSDDKILNLARGGDSFAEMRAKLEYLLKSGHRPRRIVLSLSWHSFSKGRAVRNNRQQGELFCDSVSAQRIYGQAAWKFQLRSHVFSSFPLLNPVNARLSRRYFLHRFFPEEDKDTWSGSSREERDRMARKRLLVHFGMPYDPEQARQLEEILRLCRKENLEVLALRMPLSRPYFQKVRMTDEFQDGEVFLKTLGLPVRDWNETEVSSEEFENQDHLMRYSPTARKIRDSLVLPPR